MSKLDIKVCIEALLNYANSQLGLEEIDAIFARNQLLELFNQDSSAKNKVTTKYDKNDILESMLEYAVNNKMIDDNLTDKILFETKILGLVTPSPSNIVAKFDAIARNKSTAHATNYLFDLSKNNNYIRMKDIKQNKKWSHEGKGGKIDITINLSKPEKDPKTIEKMLKAKDTSYPKCVICKENLGFPGNLSKSARQTLRMIPVPLNNEPWYLQMSPYQYFDNHCIAISAEHKPMKIDINTFKRLLDFLDLFPHYFIGSNAALPIVGGSILTHEHYQGGSKVLPMMNAGFSHEFSVPKKDVKVYILDWYNSCIQIAGDKKEEVIDTANHILNTWQKYDNAKINIKSKTDKTPHNTVTPIARKDNGTYIIDLILRNNNCDESHPYGIFHPEERLHNIKKEGIGIIEVMGLFILPGRLSNEITQISKYLTHECKLDLEKLMTDTKSLMHKHAEMICQLVNDNQEKMEEQAAINAVTQYINKSCEEILYTTGVFKKDATGQKAFVDFMVKKLKFKVKD